MARVTMKNVYKDYTMFGGAMAVTDFNLEIKDGEVIVLIGPSGCGKTSTLFMLAGLEEVSKGEIYFDDRLINNVHPKDRSVALVFYNFALFPYMTVFENIAFGLKPNNLTEAEIKEKVDEVAKVLFLEHLYDRKPQKLSAGQKQRVALARALVRKNGVVCLDEPLSNLDARLRTSMRVELMKIHQKFKTTFIYVTHDQDEAMTIADRIVVMREGLISQVGTPQELYAHPANTFVAGFIGSPMMNFWDTKVIEQNGDVFISFGEDKIKLREDKADKASAYIGKEVIAGVRHDHIYADEENIKKFSDSLIDIEVKIREFMGERIYLHFGDDFTARVSPDCTAKSGDKIKLAVNPEKIYLFDKDTELAIVN